MGTCRLELWWSHSTVGEFADPVVKAREYKTQPLGCMEAAAVTARRHFSWMLRHHGERGVVHLFRDVHIVPFVRWHHSYDPTEGTVNFNTTLCMGMAQEGPNANWHMISAEGFEGDNRFDTDCQRGGGKLVEFKAGSWRLRIPTNLGVKSGSYFADGTPAVSERQRLQIINDFVTQDWVTGTDFH